MITLSQLKKILDSIEQTTNNPDTVIIFEIDHGRQDPYEPTSKDECDTIQSVDMKLNLNIDPANPEPQEKPDITCMITLE